MFGLEITRDRVCPDVRYSTTVCGRISTSSEIPRIALRPSRRAGIAGRLAEFTESSGSDKRQNGTFGAASRTDSPSERQPGKGGTTWPRLGVSAASTWRIHIASAVGRCRRFGPAARSLSRGLPGAALVAQPGLVSTFSSPAVAICCSHWRDWSTNRGIRAQIGAGVRKDMA